MLISKQYVSPVAQQLIHTNSLVRQAFDEVASSITNNVSPGQSIFILNNSQKNCNGVVPIKEHCYQILEESYGWFRERPLYEQIMCWNQKTRARYRLSNDACF